MISWIKGEPISTWENSHKLYVLINCQGLGYEVQILELLNLENTNNIIVLWLHHIKREDSDAFYGFIKKEERDFFRDVLNVKGIGPQIGMNLLKKSSLNDILHSLLNEDKSLISSVPGIGPKMTERIFLELKNKYKKVIPKKKISSNNIKKNDLEIDFIIEDVNIALYSLDYSKKQIQETLEKILSNHAFNDMENDKNNEKFTFEYLFKKSLGILEEKNRGIEH